MGSTEPGDGVSSTVVELLAVFGEDEGDKTLSVLDFARARCHGRSLGPVGPRRTGHARMRSLLEIRTLV